MLCNQGALYELVLEENARRLKELVVDLAEPVFDKNATLQQQQQQQHKPFVMNPASSSVGAVSMVWLGCSLCHHRERRDLKMLNEDQKNVMKMLAQAKDYLLVHGMPGTGKTTTVALLVCFLHPQNIITIITTTPMFL